MKLIVGLGNPGEKYFHTRHNLGFEAVEKLGDRLQGAESNWEKSQKLKSEIMKINFTLHPEPYTLILAKPLTYMNNSGLAIKLLTTYYKLHTTDLIVVHDDLDLVLGKIKIRLGGAAAGHHGVESIIKALGTDKFIRIRLGIGNLKTALGERKKEHINVEKFVLETFMPGERSKVKQMLKKSTQALEILLSEGLEKAQNQYN